MPIKYQFYADGSERAYVGTLVKEEHEWMSSNEEFDEDSVWVKEEHFDEMRKELHKLYFNISRSVGLDFIEASYFAADKMKSFLENIDE